MRWISTGIEGMHGMIYYNMSTGALAEEIGGHLVSLSEDSLRIYGQEMQRAA